MTLRAFRNINPEPIVQLTIQDRKRQWLADVIVDYTIDGKDNNIDWMLDLYTLGATVRYVTLNRAIGLINITVTVNTKHSLYEYSIIKEYVDGYRR